MPRPPARARRSDPTAHRRRRVLTGLLLALAASAGAWWWWTTARLAHRYDPLIRAVAAQHGVDPALVKAVVWRESHFHAHARGTAGELGLMQVTDAAAQEWAESAGVYPLPETHLLDPRTNLLAGTWYLAKLLQRYARTDAPEVFALADYNAGRGQVLKWARDTAATNSAAFRDAIGFPSTRAYVAHVLAHRERYRRDFR
jgi:soluble lytic murein transglycosylase